jgi:hypothetical protein
MSQEKTVKLNVDAKDAIKQVDELKKGVQDTSEGAKKSKGSFNMMKSGVRGVGLAFKAMGVGLIVSAFVALKDALGENQAVMDKVNIASAVVGDIFQKLVNTVLAVVKSLGLLGSAVGKVLKGEFSEAADLAKQSFDGVKEAVVGNNESFKDLIENTKKSAKETVAYAKAVTNLNKEVQLAEANQRLLQLQYQKEAEVQRQVRDDISLTFEERIAANEKLGQVLDEQFAEEQALAQKKLKLAELELSRNKGNIDLQVAVIDAKAEMADLDERITGQRSEQLTNLKALEKERLDAQLAAAKLIEDAKKKEAADAEALTKKLKEENEKQILDAKAKADEEFQLANERVELAQSMFQSLSDIAQQTLVKEKNALQEQLDAGLISQEEFEKASKKIEEEALKREKKNALFQILINTAQGIAGAIKAGAGLVFPANLAAIAAGVASVLAGIASAKAVLNKVPGGGGGGGDGGGESSVPNGGGGISGGGISGLIPNLENISPTGNGEQPPIQAFVIENDISNAQALQNELETQATL